MGISGLMEICLAYEASCLTLEIVSLRWLHSKKGHKLQRTDIIKHAHNAIQPITAKKRAVWVCRTKEVGPSHVFGMHLWTGPRAKSARMQLWILPKKTEKAETRLWTSIRLRQGHVTALYVKMMKLQMLWRVSLMDGWSIGNGINGSRVYASERFFFRQW